MNKAALAAAMERLRHLLTAFSNLRSPDELADAMAEAGCILAKLIQQGLVPSDDFYKEQARAALAEPVPRWDTEPRAMARQGLFRMYADDKSDSPRTVLRIVERKGTSVFRQTDYANDYAQQGQRYALFVSELLAELQQTLQQDETKPAPSLSEIELQEALSGIFRKDKERRWTAAELVPEVEKCRPGRRTSETSIGDNLAYKALLEKQGRTRTRRIKMQAVADFEQEAAKAVSRSQVPDELARLIADQERNLAADKGKRIKGKPIKGTD
jgi:hypothetical protein